MARIIGIDYGTKRVGIAVTDPLQIIVSGLDTVETDQLLPFLISYLAEEPVEKIVIGQPVHADGSPTQLDSIIKGFIEKLKKLFPKLDVDRTDEDYSSREAKRLILQSGKKKKQRKNKGLVDKTSAILILQNYLGHHHY